MNTINRNLRNVTDFIIRALKLLVVFIVKNFFVILMVIMVVLYVNTCSQYWWKPILEVPVACIPR